MSNEVFFAAAAGVNGVIAAIMTAANTDLFKPEFSRKEFSIVGNKLPVHGALIYGQGIIYNTLICKLLKEHLQSQLNDPRVARPGTIAGAVYGAAYAPEGSAAEVCVRIAGLEMIEQGEKLAAKLEAEILMRRPGKILYQSHMTSQ